MARLINKPTNPRFKRAELRKLDYGQLQAKLQETKESLMRARFEHATATLENTSLLKTLRRDIARIETIMMQMRPSKTTLKYDSRPESVK